MNIAFLNVLLMLTMCAVQVKAETTIEPFQEERDMPIINKILKDYAQFLKYETIGYEEGITEKYIKKSIIII